MDILYRRVTEGEIQRNLFSDFERHQVVDKCLRKEKDQWVIRRDPFIDQWSEKEYGILVHCLKRTIKDGGVVIGAFEKNVLKGFVSVEAKPLGTVGQYRDMTSLHVSEDRRRKGIGKQLFLEAARWAKENGGKKLYISSHSAVETQDFYAAMGCRDAEECMEFHVKNEPYDRQLEYVL